MSYGSFCQKGFMHIMHKNAIAHPILADMRKLDAFRFCSIILNVPRRQIHRHTFPTLLPSNVKSFLWQLPFLSIAHQISRSADTSPFCHSTNKGYQCVRNESRKIFSPNQWYFIQFSAALTVMRKYCLVARFRSYTSS